jgi:hypothetical protein
MDKKRIDRVEALYGLKKHRDLSDLWDGRRKVTLPVQSSPMSEYVNDVNRFLFAGGITLESNLGSDHRAHGLADAFVNQKINPVLGALWETLAIAGDVVAILRFSGTYCSLEWFDPREFKPTFKSGEMVEVAVKTKVSIDDVTYIYRFEVDAEKFCEYPLVKETEATYYDWEKNKNLISHGLGVIPAELIKINPSLKKSRGASEFSEAALNLSAAITSMEYGLDENVYFFGNPFFDSPDPRATLKDLNEKRQVLQKLPNEEGGGHSLLQPEPIDATTLDYLKYKKETFKRLMGITNTQEVRLNDASGAALRIMNDGLISRAQSKWEEIVSDGLVRLIKKYVTCAYQTGLTPLPNQEIAWEYHRSQPWFIQTDAEKLQSLDVAERLFDMGVDRAIALQMTLLPHLSLGKIEELFRTQIED